MVGSLDAQLAGHVRAEIAKSDRINNLNQIRMIDQPGLRNNTEAEDQVSALILLGPPAAKVELFVRRNLDASAGKLTVQLGGGMVAVLPNLGTLRDGIDDLGLPIPEGLRATVTADPPSTDPLNFNDTISSLRFPPLTA